MGPGGQQEGLLPKLVRQPVRCHPFASSGCHKARSHAPGAWPEGKLGEPQTGIRHIWWARSVGQVSQDGARGGAELGAVSASAATRPGSARRWVWAWLPARVLRLISLVTDRPPGGRGLARRHVAGVGLALAPPPPSLPRPRCAPGPRRQRSRPASVGSRPARHRAPGRRGAGVGGPVSGVRGETVNIQTYEMEIITGPILTLQPGPQGCTWEPGSGAPAHLCGFQQQDKPAHGRLFPCICI
uniref:uncharacterized protein LOC132671596 n=1 Tax=Panthera onca TaxID=9690 RepID=UPI002953C4D6|nr:uncharacterized protein LOC132671596 [Panthera onca]